MITITMQDVLLPNGTITTARSLYNATTGNTSAPTPYATLIGVHVMPVHHMGFRLLPEAALTSDWCITCDSGTDFDFGDYINSIVANGVNWPDTFNPNEIVTAVFVAESTPGPLQHRQVFVKRSIVGGPSNA